MSDTFVLTTPGTDEEQLRRDPKILRSLCRKEVQRFEDYLRATDGQFADGLSRFEKLVVEGYIYQKATGHIDAYHHQGSDSQERHDGETPSS